MCHFFIDNTPFAMARTPQGPFLNLTGCLGRTQVCVNVDASNIFLDTYSSSCGGAMDKHAWLYPKYVLPPDVFWYSGKSL